MFVLSDSGISELGLTFGCCRAYAAARGLLCRRNDGGMTGGGREGGGGESGMLGRGFPGAPIAPISRDPHRTAFGEPAPSWRSVFSILPQLFSPARPPRALSYLFTYAHYELLTKAHQSYIRRPFLLKREA